MRHFQWSLVLVILPHTPLYSTLSYPSPFKKTHFLVKNHFRLLQNPGYRNDSNFSGTKGLLIKWFRVQQLDLGKQLSRKSGINHASPSSAPWTQVFKKPGVTECIPVIPTLDTQRQVHSRGSLANHPRLISGLQVQWEDPVTSGQCLSWVFPGSWPPTQRIENKGTHRFTKEAR